MRRLYVVRESMNLGSIMTLYPKRRPKAVAISTSRDFFEFVKLLNDISLYNYEDPKIRIVYSILAEIDKTLNRIRSKKKWQEYAFWRDSKNPLKKAAHFKKLLAGGRDARREVTKLDRLLGYYQKIDRFEKEFRDAMGLVHLLS